MSTKHFLNDPTHLVNSALRSITLTNPLVALDPEHKIIYRRPTQNSSSQPNKKVSIISGGGSGHEPSFAAMVGPGLLDAAVSGTIFASPSAEQVRVAIMSRVDHASSSKEKDSGGGVLVTVMNYTGDVLNFGVAVEKARAAATGIPVEMVIVGDDVGVGRTKSGKVGRRGIAGTVLVHKITGALAAQGYGLADVTKVARLVADNLVSVGASLGHVHVPGRSKITQNDDTEGSFLGQDEVEIGMGIHNEPGSSIQSEEGGVKLPNLVKKMLSQLLDMSDKDRAFVTVNSNEVVLLVNNLGGVSPLEMGGIVTEVVDQLKENWNIRPVRILSGTYMTSLNGNGFSITLLNVVNTDIGGPGMVDLLDFPAECVGWAAPISKLAWEEKNMATREDSSSLGDVEETTRTSGLEFEDSKAAQERLEYGLKRVVQVEPEVTRYDTVVGDGDCGIGLTRGAQAILKHLSTTPLTGDVVSDVSRIVPVVENNMDGTSGALYAIFLNSLVAALKSAVGGEEGKTQASPKIWAQTLRKSCDSLSKYTPARPGDRTLVDALCPFVETLEETGDIEKAALAAKAGADKTKGMKASLGRTVYVGGDGFETVPDPGAWGLASFFLGLAGVKIEEASSAPLQQEKGDDDKMDDETEEGFSTPPAEKEKDDDWEAI
ncbi:Dak1 domain-containing protein [Rhypophila decipiens]|uniref:Dak1 domain-containing protein n=1 Tax=Rhypophila decipiens TaxID=261697 RepID=A0AAN7BDK1_9PEZI|nr:Dak1 domain-containing protein [Rhypophila decipiens]